MLHTNATLILHVMNSMPSCQTLDMWFAIGNVFKKDHSNYTQHAIDGDIDKTMSRKRNLSRNCLSTLYGTFSCILIGGLTFTFIIQHQLKNGKLHPTLNR
jgi:hypothetical protein